MLRCRKIFLKNNLVNRQLSTVIQQKNVDNEYSDVAEYPPIEERSIQINMLRRGKRWSEKIKKIETIEEKLIELNLPRYYGYKCLMLDEKVFPYNTLPFFKYVTNTDFAEEKSHVPKTEEEAKKIEECLNNVRSEVLDAFEFELDAYKQVYHLLLLSSRNYFCYFQGNLSTSNRQRSLKTKSIEPKAVESSNRSIGSSLMLWELTTVIYLKRISILILVMMHFGWLAVSNRLERSN
jgi:hypothetical protein